MTGWILIVVSSMYGVEKNVTVTYYPSKVVCQEAKKVVENQHFTVNVTCKEL